MFQRLGHTHQPQWSSTNSHVCLIHMCICTYHHSAIFTNDVTYIYESCLNGLPHAHQRQKSCAISTVCLVRMYICMYHHLAIFRNNVTYVYELCHNDFDTLINARGLPQSALSVSYVCIYVCTITWPYSGIMSHTYMSHVTTTWTRSSTTVFVYNKPCTAQEWRDRTLVGHEPLIWGDYRQ